MGPLSLYPDIAAGCLFEESGDTVQLRHTVLFVRD